jgi:hypothetical protein
MEDRFKKYIRHNFIGGHENDSKMFVPTDEQMHCEQQLAMLGDYAKLNFNLDIDKFNSEIEPYNDKWVDYLPREGESDPRYGLMLWGLEGDDCNDSLSLPEARKRVGHKVMEADFNYPTQLYKDLTSIHDLCDYFSPLGRTFLVRADAGAYFPPHRDHQYLTRDCFRICAFFDNTDDEAFEWEQNGRRLPITPGNVIYIDTTKVHRTHAWANGSIHLIMNIPKTWDNVIKLISVLGV